MEPAPLDDDEMAQTRDIACLPDPAEALNNFVTPVG